MGPPRRDQLATELTRRLRTLQFVLPAVTEADALDLSLGGRRRIAARLAREARRTWASVRGGETPWHYCRARHEALIRATLLELAAVELMELCE